MNKKNINKIITFLYVFIFVLFLHNNNVLSEVYYNDSQAKDTTHFINHEDLGQIRCYIEKGNILDYLRIRQKLYTLKFDELRQLKKYVKNKTVMKPLVNIIDEICAEKANLYTFKEVFLLNNIPLLAHLPFYKGEGRNIAAIEKSAERLYFNNLKLSYKKNLLEEISDDWSINPQMVKKNSRAFGIEKSEIAQQYINDETAYLKASQKWAYRLSPNSLYNISQIRALIKKYNESLIQPIVLEEIVLLRNAYRIFAVDFYTGEQLWSMSPDISGEGFYETTMHPHHGPYGYEMAFDGNVLYAELNGKLVAYDISKRERPVLKWENDLGEYTLATRPVRLEEILLVGLINARGELWICGFSEKEGDLQWSTYIGLSSFASPVCNMSLVMDEKVLVGTNHGILICINASNGEIVWVRNYEPKQYSVFKWFIDKQFRYKNLEHEGFIEFDSEFLTQGPAGSIIYKPHESDFLYLLDSETGELIDKIQNDSKKYCILSKIGSNLIIVKKQDKDAQKLTIVEYRDGKVIYSRVLKNGELRGSLHENKGGLVFKIGQTVYMLTSKENKIELSEIDCGKEGWLIGYEKGSIFLGEKDSVQCLEIIGKNKSPHRSNIKNKQSLLLDIREILNRSHERRNKIEDRANDSLFTRLEDSVVSAQEIVPDILRNIETLKDGRLKGFFSKLKHLFGNEVVRYKEIDLKFDRFLLALGLVDTPLKENTYLPKSKPKKNRYYVTGPSSISLLSINVIKGSEPDFFILSHNDMVYCVDENENILWARKTAFRKLAGVVGEVDIYLYHDVIIINDKINVIAVDSKTGNYIWSVAYKEINDKNVFLNLNEQIGYKLTFLDDKVILAGKNKVFLIDPFSGFCLKEVSIEVDNIEKIYSFGKTILLCTKKKITSKALLRVKKDMAYDIYVLSDKLEIQNKINLGNEKIELKYVDLSLFGKKVVTVFLSGMYIYDIDTKITGKFYDLGDSVKPYLEINGNNLILIEPFKSIVGFKSNGNSFAVKWRLNLGSGDVKAILCQDFKTTFLMDDKNAIVFTKKNKDYSLVSINTENGMSNWDRALSSIGGEFADLYKMHCVDNFIYLIAYSAFKFSDGIVQKEPMEKEDFTFNIYPVLIKLNKTTGSVEYVKEFPRVTSFGYRRGVITHTKNYLLFTVNENSLYAERR